MTTDNTAAKPRLIVNDTRVCWLFPDGSHRGVTQRDVDQVNRLLSCAEGLQMEVNIRGQ